MLFPVYLVFALEIFERNESTLDTFALLAGGTDSDGGHLKETTHFSSYCMRFPSSWVGLVITN
jgi:hypothetical protein